MYLKKNLFFTYTFVWGLAVMELTFFTAAHRVLCFRFVTKTVLMTHQRFVSAQHQSFLFFSLYYPSLPSASRQPN